MKNVKCKNCGWVHFEVNLDYCIQWEKEWVVHWNNFDEQTRDMYGLKDGPAKIENEYLNCHRCNGNYKDFIDANPEDVPYGSTINPVLCRDEELIR